MTNPTLANAAVDRAPPGWLDRGAALLAPRIRDLGGRGTLVAPLIIVFAVSLAASGAAWRWASSAPAGTGAALLSGSASLVWLLALLAPLAAAVKGTLFAAMGWGVLVLLGGTPRVRSLLSALFYGEAVLSLQALWVTAGALIVGHSAAGQGPAGGMPIPSGLDAWIGGSGGVVLAVAQHVTPFHLGWVALLAVAFVAHSGVSRWGGVGTALLLWSVSTGLAILRLPVP